MRRYLDTQGAAAFLKQLGVKASPTYLRRLRSRSVGGGPAFYRTGSRGPVRYVAEDLLSWVEQRRVDPPTRKPGVSEGTPTRP